MVVAVSGKITFPLNQTNGNSIPLSKLKIITKHFASINKGKYKGWTSYLNKGRRLKYVQLLEKEPYIKDVIFTVIGKTGKDVISNDENTNLVSMLEYAKNYNQSMNNGEDEDN